MSNFITKILRISEQYSFIKPIIKEDRVVSFEYGPLGELLCQNITNEWNISNMIVRDNPAFAFYRSVDSGNFFESIKTPFMEARRITQNSLPFSITCSRIPKAHSEYTETLAKESTYFRSSKTTELKNITFTAPEEGRQFFHFWQRQRKIWWRKFSADPGRFFLSEIKNDGDIEYTDIQAKFEWGVESIERIRVLPESSFKHLPVEDQEEWMIKVKKKKILPNVIESVTNLDCAAFCFLCDAFIEETRLDTNKLRQFMKFHRKLAPYKAAFVIDTSGTSHREDLKLLAEYLALNIKKVGISVLYVPLLCTNPVEEMIEYYDLLGIPFVVVLKPSTLADGIFGLRSRETTLQELLNINQLTEHLQILLKNY
ncbi:DNA polymerase subunit gamma-2, mitochondrial [Planococcus citri]|uniref:DNA polymerase subunit gamma-2, mitochondrial n=1 Tax=Planococcus citri TaxID=170843 RepID=UPI0031F87307